MRLGIKILNTSATVNQYKHVDSITIARGETVEVIFQLVDLDQNGLRYIPEDGATVQVQIARQPEILKVNQSSRQTIDHSIDREAGEAFNGDRSVWKLPLVEADTKNMVSTSIKIIVTEGQKKKIASVQQAIKIIES